MKKDKQAHTSCHAVAINYGKRVQCQLKKKKEKKRKYPVKTWMNTNNDTNYRKTRTNATRGLS